MPTHQAIFINKKSRNGYKPNEHRTIVRERTIEGNLRVTSQGAELNPVPIIYDRDEDFHRDWQILSTIDH